MATDYPACSKCGRPVDAKSPNAALDSGTGKWMHKDCGAPRGGVSGSHAPKGPSSAGK